MERSSRPNPIKRLLHEVPRGTPLDLADLSKHGADAKAASAYARRGWLVRLGQGVYALPSDEVSALSVVRLFQRNIKGLHVGGKSALALHGDRHNLTVRETLVLWANRRFALPRWFSARFPARAVGARLFDPLAVQLAQKTVTTLPGVPEELHVSTPERAALEMLYEVGTHESLEETRSVFEGLHNLRADVLGQLLAVCTSVKAVRLFLTWSRETGVVDVDMLRKRFQPRVGSASRWVNRLPDGTLLMLKPYGEGSLSSSQTPGFKDMEEDGPMSDNAFQDRRAR